MFIWLYQLPTWLIGCLIVGLCVAVGVAGLYLTRPWFPPETRRENHLSGTFTEAVSVIYAVLLALVAVTTWDNYRTTNDMVDGEANSVSDLYRNMSGYPEPFRSRTRAELRRYVEVVIREEWPAMQQDHHSLPALPALPIVEGLTRELVKFQPQTEGQKIIHAQNLRELNDFWDYRRQRIHDTREGVLPVMWGVILFGGLVTLAMSYSFWTDNFRLHRWLTSAYSAIVGLMIFQIAALDHPLLGRTGIQPDRFHSVLEMMESPGERFP